MEKSRDNYLSSDRKDFEKGSLNEADTPENPFLLFEEWLEKAIDVEESEAYCMVLSTVFENVPKNRVLFLRGFMDQKFLFYTNYGSAKGKEMSDNNNVALNFYWSKLERQVRIQGTVEKCSAEQSDAYFAGRPRESQIGAWASQQSASLEKREDLLTRVAEMEERFENDTIPRPEHWGGYEVCASEIEFWQGGKNRLHDRIAYSLENENWTKRRLFP